MATAPVNLIALREFVIFIDGWPHNAQLDRPLAVPKSDAANLVKAGYARYADARSAVGPTETKDEPAAAVKSRARTT